MTLEELKNIPAKNGIIYLTDQLPGRKNNLYIQTRTIEGRLLDDRIVLQLPDIPGDHPLKRQWDIRRKSAARLMEYLNKKNTALNILDVGCGNGWMSNLLTKIPKSHVYALDLNITELEQGARVFSSNSRLHFLFADIYESPLPEYAFDIITVASAIQYFPDLRILIERLLRLLNQNGEIHIFDSPLYTDSSVEAARGRSKAYYATIGIPEMSELYFHHTYAGLKDFNYTFLYQPNSMINRIIRNSSPFPWIRISQ